jgi:hypothetical protein
VNIASFATTHRVGRVKGLGALLLVFAMLAALLPATVFAAAATKLVITSVVPASATSGQAIVVTVEAQDGTSAIDTGFVGSVTFITSDGAATVSPASVYTYTLADAGTKTFSVTLRSFGTRTFSFHSGALTDTATKSVLVTASRVAFTTSPAGGASNAAWGAILEIRDETGAKVTTSTATIVLSIGTNPSAGALSGCTGLTAVAGVVTVTGCKIDKAGVGYTLIATSSGLTSGTSGAFTITAGAANKLGFVTQPARGVPGIAFAVQPVVAVQDALGNTVTGDNATVVTLTASSGFLTCTGTTSRTVSAGLATFTGCGVPTAGVGLTLAATSSPSFAAATSAPLDVADRLLFTTQPSGATAGTAFTTQPVVTVKAGATNTAVHDSGTVVTLSLKAGTGTAGAALTCDSGLSKTVVAGVAAFTGCLIDKASPVSPANPYVIVASASGLTSAESTTIVVNPGAATKLGFTAQPTSASSNQAFPIQPVVAVQDLGGNTVTSGTNSTATITLAIGTNPAVGTLTCTGGLTKVAVAGVATFAGCQINNAGVGYTLTATASGLTTATSTAFTVGAPAATITLTTSASVITWASGIVLTTQFSTNGAGRSFQLQATRDGVTWATAATLTTDASGRATFAYRPATNNWYRVVFAGVPDLAAATSATVRTVVRQIALLRPTNGGHVKSIARNTSIAFTTTVRPARPELAPAKVSFYFYRKIGSSWVLNAKRDVYINAAGLARTTFKFTSSGQWYVRSAANPTTYNANSIPSPLERYNVY